MVTVKHYKNCCYCFPKSEFNRVMFLLFLLLHSQGMRHCWDQKAMHTTRCFQRKGHLLSCLHTLPLLQRLAQRCCHFWSCNKLLVEFTLCSFLHVIFQRPGYAVVLFSPCFSLCELLVSLSRMALQQMLNLIALPRLEDRKGIRCSWNVWTEADV